MAEEKLSLSIAAFQIERVVRRGVVTDDARFVLHGGGDPLQLCRASIRHRNQEEAINISMITITRGQVLQMSTALSMAADWLHEQSEATK